MKTCADLQRSQRDVHNSGRRLKIEKLGDEWRGKIFSGIRLKGYWLTEAGFPFGENVTVSVLSPGLLELRVTANSEDEISREARQRVQAQIDQAISRAKGQML